MVLKNRTGTEEKNQNRRMDISLSLSLSFSLLLSPAIFLCLMTERERKNEKGMTGYNTLNCKVYYLLFSPSLVKRLSLTHSSLPRVEEQVLSSSAFSSTLSFPSISSQSFLLTSSLSILLSLPCSLSLSLPPSLSLSL